jgi:hypothetical protein
MQTQFHAKTKKTLIASTAKTVHRRQTGVRPWTVAVVKLLELIAAFGNVVNTEVVVVSTCNNSNHSTE